MKKAISVCIAVALALIVISCAVSYKAGYRQGSSNGQQFVKDNILYELKSLGISHLDITGHSYYFVPVSLTFEQESQLRPKLKWF